MKNCQNKIMGSPISMKNTFKALILCSLVLVISLSPFITYGNETGSYSGELHTVVYHPFTEMPTVDTDFNGETGDITYTTSYRGSIVSTEYNPQVWTVADKWFPIKEYSPGNTLVFAGWLYLQNNGSGTATYSEPMYPGDVMSEDQMSAATSDGCIHVYANWEKLQSYSEVKYRTWRYYVDTEGDPSNGNVFTNILVNGYSLNANQCENMLEDVGEALTMRGGTIALGNSTLSLMKDTILDGMGITGTFSSSSTHGDGGRGLFAEGNLLIIGTGIDNGNGTSNTDYPQVFGGSNGGTVQKTNTIIHNGTYGNVISGSRGGSVNGDSRIILKDVHILDTLIGACSGTGSVSGSTYIYATSLQMHGDYYEEHSLDPEYTGAGPTGRVVMTESTILTGGSNNGSVGGNTFVHISGDSVLWDVQGAGRRGQSEVTDTAHVHISGTAWVKHVVCGSITDGLDGSNSGVSGSNECVKNTCITIGDNAMVGSVFGAGYDTFYKARYSSMYNGGTIEVTLEDDCTVGYVYGGGYRGTIGSSNGDGRGVSPLDSIHIHINGGTVLGDVYGGGRGGVDKICHNTDGSHNWGSSHDDSTGYSKVFVDEVILTIDGGTILGNVYGGGESVPVIEGYDYESGVASMEAGSITINVLSESHVDGNIYGGGKGISSNLGEPDIIVIDSQGTINRIPWLLNNPSYSVYNPTTYTEYASTNASFVHINIKGPDISNLFGGGAYGTMESMGIYIEIDEGADVQGTVFGGGMGSTSDGLLGTVKAGTIDIRVSGGSLINSGTRGYSVMGGGTFAYVDTGSVSIEISGKTTRLNGDVHAGGLGYERNDGSLPAIMDICHREIVLSDATVSGSIYGGSRLGHDSPLDSTPDSSDYGQTYILIPSGTVTQSIYGGGFQGKSYLDSHILIGSPAFEYLGTTPATEEGHNHVALTLLVHNIYGGGNLSGGEPYVQALLEGNSEISIGGTFENGLTYRMGREIIDGTKTHVMCIHGNIYGHGNYSTVGGESSINIDGYDQYGDHSIWSIQRSDILRISNCHLEIRGAADGGSTELSQIVSLNRIDSLILSNESHLELCSETSMIGNYLSSTDGTVPTTHSDCRIVDGEIHANRITMHGGRMFSVLGEMNMGYIDINSNNRLDEGEPYAGMISGFTVLSAKDSGDYYGAYAIGSLGTDTSTAGFMVVSDDELIDADILDGDGIVNITRTWYIIGHVEIGRTWTFEKDVNDGSEIWKIQDLVSLPRMGGTGTVFAYNGMVNNPLSLGTMLFVNSNEFDQYIGRDGFSPQEDVGSRMFFNLNLTGNIIDSSGLEIGSHVLSDDSWIRTGFSGYTILGGDGVQLTFDSKLLSYEYYGGEGHLGSSGVIGIVLISFLEMVEYTSTSGGESFQTYLPVNMVDVEVTIYVEPRDVTEGKEVQLATVVNVTPGSEGYLGTGYIILPGLGSMADYYFSWYSDTFEDGSNHNVSAYADDQHLDQLGWVTTIYGTDALDVIKDGSVTLDGETYFGKGGIRPSVIRMEYAGDTVSKDSIDLHIRCEGEITETVYHVRVTFQLAGDVEISLKYAPVFDGGLKTLLFEGTGTEDDPMTMQWIEGDASISIPYGSSMTSTQFFYVDSEYPLITIINESIGIIPPDSADYFDYVLYFHGWYLDKGHTRQFNPSESVREDTTLYAGFGITIRFHGDGVTVIPQTVTIEPGTSLNDNGLYNIEDEIPNDVTGIRPYAGIGDDRKGYRLMKFGTDTPIMSWALRIHDEFASMDFSQKLYSDHDGDSIIDLYLPWIAYVYSMTVDIDDSSPEGSTVTSVTMSDEIIQPESSVYRVSYDTLVRVGFNFNVSEVTLSDGDFNISGINTRTLEFTVPYIGNDGSSFTLEVILATGITVTFRYVSDGNASTLKDSEKISLTLRDSDGTVPLTLDNTNRVAMATVSTDSTNTLEVDIPAGYFWAAWSDDVLITTGGLGGRVDLSSIELGTFKTDCTVVMAVYWSVGFDDSMGDVIGSGSPIESVTVTGIDLDGTSTYNVSVSWSNGTYTGDPLFEGYTLEVEMTDGYSIFETAGVSGDSPNYKILGTVDVLLRCRVNTTWTLEVTFLRNNSPITLGVLVRNSTGSVLEVDIDGTQQRYDLEDEINSFTDDTGTLRNTLSGFVPSDVKCIFGGFFQDTPEVNGDTVHVNMTMISYKVVFDGYTIDETATWHVFSRGQLPSTNADTAIDADGHKVWIDETGTTRVTELQPSMFDDDNSITLRFLPPFSYSLTWEDDVLVDGTTIVTSESAIESGITIEIDLGADEVILDDIGYLVITYKNGELHLYAEEAGTGSIVFEIGTETLILFVLPDFDVYMNDTQTTRNTAS